MKRILGMSGLLIMLFSITAFADINKELIKSAKKGKVEDVYQLLKNGADVNVKGRKDLTPLHFASIKGHIEVVRILLENGADINARDNKGRVPQELALAKKRMNVLALLKEQKVKYDWGRAKKLNTENAYHQFIRSHNGDPLSSEAEQKIIDLRWVEARSRNTKHSLNDFVASYPDSVYILEAKTQITEIDWKQVTEEGTIESLDSFVQKYPQSKHVSEAQRLIEDVSWKEAILTNGRSDYVQFIKTFPTSKYRRVAEERIHEFDWSEFEASPSVEQYRKYAKAYPGKVRTDENLSQIAKLVWNKVSTIDKRSSYANFVDEFPESPFAQQANGKLHEIDWRFAQAEGTRVNYEDFVTKYPQSGHASEAKNLIKRLSWVEAKQIDTSSAYSEFLQKFPESPHAAEARSFIARDAARWNVRLLDSIDAVAMHMKEFDGIKSGGRIIAEYYTDEEPKTDHGIHISTYTWNFDSLDKSTRDSTWNDNVLAVIDQENTAYDKSFGILVEITRQDTLGVALFDFSCAQLLCTNGETLAPCGLFLANVDETVTGVFQGFLFTGNISFGAVKYKSFQAGPPYAGKVKVSLLSGAFSTGTQYFTLSDSLEMSLESKIKSSFKFEPNSKVTLGLLFQAKMEEAQELFVLGRAVPLTR
ncbi:MAG: hypothetical protein GY797_03240 [Deltaproteobacteria bacterium]|nr:hypothetical protein [Deltaproteobacteria bacterium]